MEFITEVDQTIPSTITLWRERFVFTSPSFVSSSSTRPSLVLLIGPLSEITLICEGMRHVGRVFLVNANVARAVDAEAAGLYSFHLDLSNRTSRYLRTRVLNGMPFVDLTRNTPLELFPPLIESVFGAEDNCADSYRKSQAVINCLFPQVATLPPIDLRVDMVANWLWTHVPPRVDLRFLSSLSGLSQSRVAHLFTEEVGISIRQYLLWVKMRKAVDLFAGNRPLAEVAHAIGFADSAHLSRTFRRFFSLKPSFLNSKLVRVQLCDELAHARR